MVWEFTRGDPLGVRLLVWELSRGDPLGVMVMNFRGELLADPTEVNVHRAVDLGTTGHVLSDKVIQRVRRRVLPMKHSSGDYI